MFFFFFGSNKLKNYQNNKIKMHIYTHSSITNKKFSKISLKIKCLSKEKWFFKEEKKYFKIYINVIYLH